MIQLDAFFKRPALEGVERRAGEAEGGTLTPDMDRMRKRAEKALHKAIKERPFVRKLLLLNQLPSIRRYYSVQGRHVGANEYLVTLMRDRDRHWYATCTCLAGDPPADDYTGVISWHPQPCYHVAATLLLITRTAKANDARRKPRELVAEG